MADDKEFECITCSQLVSRMASKQMQMSRADVKMAVRVTLDYMSDVLSRGQRIEVRGFGSFSVRFRKPRMTRNPKTRRTVFITGRSLPCFKSSTLLLDRVNKRPRGYTLLDPGYPEEHRAPAGAEIVPAIEDMPHEAPAQTEAAENRPGGTDAQTGFGAQPDAGAQHNAGAQANTGAQGNAGAHADTGAQAGAESQANTGAQADTGTAPGAPAAMNAGADAARGGRDEGRDDAAPPERDSGVV
ncbi:MAG: HU family DNA-binding protein [Gammaproteobacteria bacterium]|nr:HU family DNA-binding protein [Gammaproteobacteria bacterium]